MEVAIIVPVVSMISLVTIIIFVRKFTNDERMAMIEKGDTNFAFNKYNSSGPLRYGLLLVGAGLGLLIGNIFSSILTAVSEDAIHFSFIFIFSGLGLLTAYILEEKKKKEDK
jgi:hypothetical protein